MSEARQACDHCIAGTIVDLSQASNCIAHWFATRVDNDLRGVAIVPKLTSYLQHQDMAYPGYGVALQMGHIFTVGVQLARRIPNTRMAEYGPTLKVVFLLPKERR